MRCPLDVDVDLVMSERQGVEIDYCPRCRGVWLDRGELDKILDRAAAEAPSQAPHRPPAVGGLAAGHVSGEGGTGLGYDPVLGAGRARPEGFPYGEDRPRQGEDRPRHGEDAHRRKRKESWLGDLLDFG